MAEEAGVPGAAGGRAVAIVADLDRKRERCQQGLGAMRSRGGTRAQQCEGRDQREQQGLHPGAAPDHQQGPSSPGRAGCRPVPGREAGSVSGKTEMRDRPFMPPSSTAAAA
ncbi:hypothetical protein D0Z66_15980 [Cereibacter sphaeroides]|nr:hypothetical protein D0Z66_15980 [Cereibacter sphaeroides]